MKELTIEQKAKAYDKAFRIAQELYNNPNSSSVGKGYVYTVFPELKESENERIKKALIDYFDDANKADENPLQSYGIHTDKAIAWLEKQGQEPKKVSIWKHWKNGIAGNAEDKQIYLIKIGDIYKLSSFLAVECDYIELSELDNLMLEKQWKPSKEQMEALWNVYEGGEKQSALASLYNDLKKL